MEHHVYFWLDPAHKSPSARAEFEAGLATLLEIPLLQSGFWATPAPVMPRPVIDSSWDYALSMRFASVADQDIYQDHPAHHEFLRRFRDRWAKVLVMDLEESGSSPPDL